jgi:hypothetical protein
MPQYFSMFFFVFLTNFVSYTENPVYNSDVFVKVMIIK